MSWRFFATRLDGKGGETLIHPELPVSSTKPIRTLSGADQIDLTIPIADANLIDWDTGQPILVPRSTMIYAERNGVIICGGYVRDLDPHLGQLSIRCIGMSAFIDRMWYGGDFKQYEVDPIEMGRMIWNYAQSRPKANLGLFYDANTTPVRIGKRGQAAFRGRPVIYDLQGNAIWTALPPTEAVKDDPWVLAWYKDSNLGKSFRSLAAETPFDYKEWHYWDSDRKNIFHRLVVRYPQIGRRVPEDVRFVVGENVVVAPKLQDSEDFWATDVWCLGAGEGTKMIFGSSNTVSHPRLYAQHVVQDATVDNKERAARVAGLKLNNMAGGLEVEELIVRNHALAPFGSYDVGDRVKLHLSSQWYGEREFYVKVIEIAYNCDEGDTCTIKVKREDYNDVILEPGDS